jgi:hypothetical protein
MESPRSIGDFFYIDLHGRSDDITEYLWPLDETYGVWEIEDIVGSDEKYIPAIFDTIEIEVIDICSIFFIVGVGGASDIEPCITQVIAQ